MEQNSSLNLPVPKQNRCLLAKILTALVFIALSFSFAKAQQANNNAPQNKHYDAYDTNGDKIIDKPIIEEGFAADAKNLSYGYKALALYISGGKQENPQAVCKSIAAVFKNPQYTDHPMNIAIIYGEPNDQQAEIVVFSRGKIHDKFSISQLNEHKIKKLGATFAAKDDSRVIK